MLFLVVRIGDDRYALEASCIVEVLPLVEIKRLPRAAQGVAGILTYRGAPIPAIDLSMLAIGRASAQRLSTRIVVVTTNDVNGRTQRVGLIAEGTTETMRRERDDFATFGMASDAAPYLGPVTRSERGLIQWVDVDRLLSNAIRESLSGIAG